MTNRKEKKTPFPSFHAFDSFRRSTTDESFQSRGGAGIEQQTQVVTSHTSFVLLCVICFLILTFFVKLFSLQILSHDDYLLQARQNSSHNLVYSPPRGIIVDRNGRVLAHNRPLFELWLDRGKIPERTSPRDFLDSLTVPETITIDDPGTQSGDRTSFLIDSDSRYETGLAYRAFVLEHPGFFVRVLPERIYPYGKALSHFIGYIGFASEHEWDVIQHKDTYALVSEKIGKTGLEKQFEPILKGERGVTTIETNALGEAVRVIEEQKPESRAVVKVSIDAELQKRSFEALEASIRSNSGSGGAVLVSNIKSGEIVTLASSPSFDNNFFVQNDTRGIRSVLEDKNLPLFFRAVSGEYPSGSIIKPVFALAALNEGIITPKTTVQSTGGIRVGSFFFPDWKEGGHGNVDVIRALAESVNTFFYSIGGGHESIKGLGVDTLGDYARMFGMGSVVGIGIGEESTGFIPSPAWKEQEKHDRWYIGDTYHLALGQGDLLVTPIQMLKMIASIANQGEVMRLHVTPQDSPVTTYLPIAKEYFEVVSQGLREAVLTGSARQLSDLPISVAGKTGTAEVGGKRPNAWFVGFTPYENPRFAIVILVEGGGEGSVAAVPVARVVIQELLARYSFN